MCTIKDDSRFFCVSQNPWAKGDPPVFAITSSTSSAHLDRDRFDHMCTLKSTCTATPCIGYSLVETMVPRWRGTANRRDTQLNL